MRTTFEVNDRCLISLLLSSLCLDTETVTIFTGDRKLPSPTPTHHFLLLIRQWQAVCPGAASTQNRKPGFINDEGAKDKLYVCELVC